MFEGFTVIAGPCVLEDSGLNIEIGQEVRRVCADLGLTAIFKASFDKANRARPDAPRGPGLIAGIALLDEVRRETGLSVLADIHEPSQADRISAVADVIQVPAFLVRQTDLVVAAGRTGLVVNLKKGQWMAPEEMAGAVAKARGAGAAGVTVTERGTFFGYGDLVVDMRSFARMRSVCLCPVVFDGTHSVQRPGRGAGGASGACREHVETLVLAAVAAGCDALFLETHPSPNRAPSDGDSMWPLADLASLLKKVSAILSIRGGPDGRG